MSLEMETVDNDNSSKVDKKALKRLFPIVTETQRDLNLFLNEDKTEFCHVSLLDNLAENETIP